MHSCVLLCVLSDCRRCRMRLRHVTKLVICTTLLNEICFFQRNFCKILRGQNRASIRWCMLRTMASILDVHPDGNKKLTLAHSTLPVERVSVTQSNDALVSSRFSASKYDMACRQVVALHGLQNQILLETAISSTLERKSIVEMPVPARSGFVGKKTQGGTGKTIGPPTEEGQCKRV